MPQTVSAFKRQNTVDSATIKENTQRMQSSRPASATPKISSTGGNIDSSKFKISDNGYIYVHFIVAVCRNILCLCESKLHL